MKNFEFIYPLSKTKEYMGELSIQGTYSMQNGELYVEVERVEYNRGISLHNWIPYEVQHAFGFADTISDVAYEHCKGLLPMPEHITDLKTQNKLS